MEKVVFGVDATWSERLRAKWTILLQGQDYYRARRGQFLAVFETRYIQPIASGISFDVSVKKQLFEKIIPFY